MNATHSPVFPPPVKVLKRRRSRKRGSTRRCSCCPYYTPNLAGVCDVCLQLDVPARKAAERVTYPKLSTRQITALINPKRIEHEPAAVARGRGIRVPG